LHNLEISEKIILPSIKDAITMAKDAWKLVSTDTIRNCFKHTQIVDLADNRNAPEIVNQEACEIERDINGNILTWKQKLQKYYKNASDLDCFNLEEYLDIDKDEKTGETLSLEDIVEIAKEEEPIPEDVNDPNEIEPKKMIYSDALQHLKGIENYIHQLGEVPDTIFDLVSQLKGEMEKISESKKVQTTLDNFFIKM
jgi:hypothetical protein